MKDVSKFMEKVEIMIDPKQEKFFWGAMTEGDSLGKKKSTKKDEKLKKQNKKTSKIFLEKVMKSAPGIDQTWMIPKRMMEQVKRT